MDVLILKGGNALDLIHGIAQRASFDLDFSIASCFEEECLPDIGNRIRRLLEMTYKAAGYHAYDITFCKRPSQLRPELEGWWGGYLIEFKLIQSDRHEELKADIDALRRNSLTVGERGSTKLCIEISCHECLTMIEERDVDGFLVRVYSPILIAIEKLRAICQHMKEYREEVLLASPSPRGAPSPRARDFFDIYTIVTVCGIDLLNDCNRRLIADVFAAKRVPLSHLRRLEDYREAHRDDFVAVKDTLKPGVEIRDFDFYFDFVKSICDRL